MQYKSERQRKAEQITVDRLDEVRAGIWFMEARNEDGEHREYTLVPEEFWSSVPDDRFRAWDEGVVSKYMRRAALESEEFFQQLGNGVDAFEAMPHEIGNADVSTADSGVPTSDPVAVEAARDALDEIEEAREEQKESDDVDELVDVVRAVHGFHDADSYEYEVDDSLPLAQKLYIEGHVDSQFVAEYAAAAIEGMDIPDELALEALEERSVGEMQAVSDVVRDYVEESHPAMTPEDARVDDDESLSVGTPTHDVDNADDSDDEDDLSREIERLADLTDRIEELASDDG